MDTAVFWDDCAYLPEWPGVPIGDEEGRIISGVLGNKRAALLAHHGLVTACGTVEEAAMLALFMERAARLQLLARAAGKIKPVGPTEAQEAHDYRLRASIIGATFCYFARKALKEDPDIVCPPSDARRRVARTAFPPLGCVRLIRTQRGGNSHDRICRRRHRVYRPTPHPAAGRARRGSRRHG